ncbi:MAG: S41 family peptidase [bacterium]|nr:S41 family peptidase [bacterium]
MKEKIKSLIVKHYVQAVGALVLFALGVWIGQNFDINVGQKTTRGEFKPLISLSNRQTPTNTTVSFNQFWEVWDHLTSEYLNKNDIDQQKLLYGAISGLVEAAGDPYTVYLDPESNKDFDSQLNGTFEGVGIEIGSKDGKLVVISPIEGTPAMEAGVLAGDIITKIDGKDASSLSLVEAVKTIRGQAGTPVHFVFSRAGKLVNKTITRTKITIKSVEFANKGEEVAVIRINRFGDSTQEEWDSAVNKFTSGKFQKLILDLRNNPGGRLDTAIYIANEFVAAGTSVVLEEDSGGNRQEFKGERNGRLQEITPVVLLNKGSASASEIVAGALRDLKGAPLLGETSYGKGTVQKVEDLEAGAALHITIAKWLTPKGIWVHGKGLKPDTEVKLTAKDIKANKDPQLEAALKLLK